MQNGKWPWATQQLPYAAFCPGSAIPRTSELPTLRALLGQRGPSPHSSEPQRCLQGLEWGPPGRCTLVPQVTKSGQARKSGLWKPCLRWTSQSHQAERLSAGPTAPPTTPAGAGRVTKARVPPEHADAASPHSGPRPNWQRTGQVLWHRESGRGGSPTAYPALQQSPVQDNLRQRWGVLGKSLLLLPQLPHLWNGWEQTFSLVCWED